ncbi:uncharacterized protein BO80DRAFT_487272, partial [Aspergillus ibericus CBS 121593]
VKPNIPSRETWGDLSCTISQDRVITTFQKPFPISAASKTESERQAWKWTRENDPGYIFNTAL